METPSHWVMTCRNKILPKPRKRLFVSVEKETTLIDAWRSIASCPAMRPHHGGPNKARQKPTTTKMFGSDTQVASWTRNIEPMVGLGLKNNVYLAVTPLPPMMIQIWPLQSKARGGTLQHRNIDWVLLVFFLVLLVSSGPVDSFRVLNGGRRSGGVVKWTQTFKWTVGPRGGHGECGECVIFRYIDGGRCASVGPREVSAYWHWRCRANADGASNNRSLLDLELGVDLLNQ